MPGVRLLHTADVHLGASFGFLGRRGREQRAQLKKTFSRVVDLAITSQVDALLISGDLFDSPYPTPDIVGEVIYHLGRLDSEGIWTFITPGTHDRLQPGGVYDANGFGDLAHVHVFKESQLTPFVIEALNLTVYGRATTREGKDVLEGFRSPRDSGWRIGMLHGSFMVPGRVERDEMMLTAESIARSDLHYLALGHWHSLADYSQGTVTAYYSGPPEPLEIAKGEKGRVLLVELEENSSVQVNPVALGNRRLMRLDINGAELGGPSGLYAHLRQMADPNLGLEARINGIWGEEWADFDWDKMEEEIAPLFFYFRLEASHYELSTHDTEAYPEKTVMGKFIRLAKAEISKREGGDALVAEEALRLGLAHLSKRY